MYAIYIISPECFDAGITALRYIFVLFKFYNLILSIVFSIFSLVWYGKMYLYSTID